MNAAVVTSFDRPPAYESIDTPAPADGLELVDVLAAALHPRARSGADGSHYTSDGVLPLVPGFDGVARLPGGEVAYFVAGDGVPGTFAEKAVLDPRLSVVLPPDVDVARIAAGMNPGMSSWVALRRRANLRPGESVLVLGATGNAGRMAIQVARHLGAATVIGAGRPGPRLDAGTARGADAVVPIGDGSGDDALAEVAAEVDVVLDYLWGPPTEAAIEALVRARQERARALRWIQIGSVAGTEMTLPSAALRAANLQVMGSGQGSVTIGGILAELPTLAEQLDAGSFDVDPKVVPLSEVENAWTDPTPNGERLVFVP
jgi:NADPH:quinone reductase-like Zn-dependent oxidoreductase